MVEESLYLAANAVKAVACANVPSAAIGRSMFACCSNIAPLDDNASSMRCSPRPLYV